MVSVNLLTEMIAVESDATQSILCYHFKEDEQCGVLRPVLAPRSIGEGLLVACFPIVKKGGRRQLVVPQNFWQWPCTGFRLIDHLFVTEMGQQALVLVASILGK